MALPRLFLTAAATAFAIALAPGVAAAQKRPPSISKPIKGTQKGGARKPAAAPTPTIHTKSDARALHRQRINEIRANIKRLERRQADFLDAVRSSPSLAGEPGAARATNTNMLELEAARVQLATLRRQTLDRFAAARNIRIIPDPPTGVPPSTLALQVPRIELRPLKSSRRPAPPDRMPPPSPSTPPPTGQPNGPQ